MKRLWLLLVALCLGGCAESQKAQWGEVMKDLRGDNMKMRGFGPSDSTSAD